MKITNVKTNANQIGISLESEQENVIVKTDLAFSMPDWKVKEYMIFGKDEIDDFLHSFLVSVPNIQHRYGFQIILQYLAKINDWPIAISNVNHPGFPNLSIQYNTGFVSREFLEDLCVNILEGIRFSTTSTEIIETDDEENEFEDFPENHVSEDETTPIEWEESPFNLGEIISEEGDDV